MPDEREDQPTPFPDVNALVRELTSGARRCLGDRLVGVYLHGSLATGDFDPSSSDVDFLVVTDDALPHDVVSALVEMHARLAASGRPFATELDGSYIPLRALRRYDPADACHPHIGVGGAISVEQHDRDWVIQRHVLREHGVVVTGPAIEDLIDPVAPDDLRDAARAVLESWWAPMLADPWRLAEPDYRAYAVLTMCRILYTLEHGTVAPKPVAARWAMEGLDADTAGLVAAALAWPRVTNVATEAEARGLIRYTLTVTGAGG